VVLVEAPLNEQRGQAVLEAVKKTIPNKPIRYVVNTHDHFDHADGLRAVAAEGIPIITQTSNTYYFVKVFGMAHTIAWDRLTQTGKQATFEGVDDKRVLSDATRQLQLIRVSTDHSDTMLVAYLPKEKILIEADLFNPPVANAAPAPVNPVTASFYDALQQLKLDVNQILPLHGRMVTMRELQTAVGKTAGH
jgi:glyoxylase-like metal-dependent hydrolase (beta-lactamase superfamily II)